MFRKLLTFREQLVISVCAVIVVVIHVAYFYATLKSGGGSIGVDGEVYRQSALDCMASNSWLLEKSNNLFWTPWYVIVALLRADPLLVFIFNLLMKYVVVFVLLQLGTILVRARWLRLGPALLWLFYWPTFNFVIFFHYEIFLAAVCGCIPLLVTWWYGLVKDRAGWINTILLGISTGIVAGIGIFSHARTVGVLAVILAPLFFVIDKKQRWKMACGVAIAVALAILPSLWWGYRNHVLYDKWVFSSTSLGYNLYVGYNEIATGYFNPQPPYPPLDQAKGMALDYMRNNPSRSFGLFLKRLVIFWAPSESAAFGPRGFIVQEYLLLPLAFAAYCISTIWLFKIVNFRFKSRVVSVTQIALVSVVIVIAWFQVFHALFYVSNPRFRIPVIPLMSVLVFVVLDRGRSLFTDRINEPVELGVSSRQRK